MMMNAWFSKDLWKTMHSSSYSRYVGNFVTPLPCRVSRSMFEYAACVSVSAFDANATILLSCRRHAHLPFCETQLPEPFPSVDDIVRHTWFAADTSLQIVVVTLHGDLRATRMERRSGLRNTVVCRQIVNQNDEQLQIFVVLWGLPSFSWGLLGFGPRPVGRVLGTRTNQTEASCSTSRKVFGKLAAAWLHRGVRVTYSREMGRLGEHKPFGRYCYKRLPFGLYVS